MNFDSNNSTQVSQDDPFGGNLLDRAKRVLPGGVNSPVRAFQGVEGDPPFLHSAQGARVRDEDGREWIDYISSWGAILLGHAHPDLIEAVCNAAGRGTNFGLTTEAEIDLAELVCDLVPSIEMLRMVSSGTEATMSAVRLARAATGRDKILKFAGGYHGHADSFLVAAGSGNATFSTPDSDGVLKAVAENTLIARFNDLNSVQQAFDAAPLAAVILEPVAGNMGCIPPEREFLENIRGLCDEHGTLLIFDEVMTGFRLAAGGAQEVFQIMPDLTTLGKILGHGLPAAAYGGRRDLMQMISPLGSVYQAGTLSGNPLAIAAGLIALEAIVEDPSLYNDLEENAARLEKGLWHAINSRGFPCNVQRVGSMWTLFFTEEKVREFEDAQLADTQAFARFHHYAMQNGVLLPPSAFETAFLTLAHDTETIDETIDALVDAIERTYT